MLEPLALHLGRSVARKGPWDYRTRGHFFPGGTIALPSGGTPELCRGVSSGPESTRLFAGALGSSAPRCAVGTLTDTFFLLRLREETAAIKAGWDAQVAQVSKEAVSRDLQAQTLQEEKAKLKAQLVRTQQDVDRYGPQGRAGVLRVLPRGAHRLLFFWVLFETVNQRQTEGNAVMRTVVESERPWDEGPTLLESWEPWQGHLLLLHQPGCALVSVLWFQEHVPE